MIANQFCYDSKIATPIIEIWYILLSTETNFAMIAEKRTTHLGV